MLNSSDSLDRRILIIDELRTNVRLTETVLSVAGCQRLLDAIQTGGQI